MNYHQTFLCSLLLSCLFCTGFSPGKNTRFYRAGFSMNDVGSHHSFNKDYIIRQTPAHTSVVSTCVVVIAIVVIIFYFMYII